MTFCGDDTACFSFILLRAFGHPSWCCSLDEHPQGIPVYPPSTLGLAKTSRQG